MLGEPVSVAPRELAYDGGSQNLLGPNPSGNSDEPRAVSDTCVEAMQVLTHIVAASPAITLIMFCPSSAQVSRSEVRITFVCSPEATMSSS